MSWKDILKDLSEDEIREHMSKVKSSRIAEEEQDAFKSSTAFDGNFVRSFKLEDQTDEFIERNKNKYIGYVAAKRNQSYAGLWVGVQFGGKSRQEVFNAMQDSFIKKRNPKPWTMEGNLYQGDAVVYDGVALMYSAPSYWYYIADGLDDIPPSNPEQEIGVDRHNPSRVIDRMKGKQFDTEEGELPSEFKDKNR